MYENVALSTYLCQRPDPQRRAFWKPDDSAVVEKWIKSVEKLGLNGIIFYDSLSEQFVEDWAGPNVVFRQVAWHTPWTAAEERVRIYRDWLRDNSCDRVLTTDLSDLEFYYDPFPLMGDPDMLYIGSEPILIGDSKWLKQRMMETYGEVTDADKPIRNPGIVGGSRKRMLIFLDQWLAEMEKAIKPVSPPHDIVSFNRLIYRDHIAFVTGHPLHTVFRSKQPADCGAAIRHK